MLARTWWRKRNTPPLLLGLKVHSTTLEISLGFLRKLDIVLPENPAIPLLGIYPKDAPAYNKDIYSNSTEEWIQKMWSTTQVFKMKNS